MKMNLNHKFTAGLTGVLLLGLCGCASIVSHSTWPITFDTNPSGVQITVSNSRGQVLQRGQSPITLTLKSGRGYFMPAYYTVEAKVNGVTTASARVSAHLNAWYAGNLVFGGAIGILIVDPATGAMYRMPQRYTLNVEKSAANNSGQSLQILTLDKVPKELRSELIAVR